ncbi:MAG TPA: LLM class flavin-dependent oxidoreductase, partial [Acidimicrobiaceae bacterium]|nr:LLM class flavin-dependent oxidoreductase [Acidimicrobiaceae bacterium]
LGALAFSFVDPDEAKTWADTYYDIIKSDECVPIGHSVNANLAMVAGFSLHEDPREAMRRGQDGFQFFRYAVNALVANETRPGRSNLWGEYEEIRGDDLPLIGAPGIGTPDDYTALVKDFESAGVDQVIFLQQGGKNEHKHICESLELFAEKVLPEFAPTRDERVEAKDAELAPYIAAALARKQYMQPLAEDEIPIVSPSQARESFYVKQ